ncbi:MAG: MBL fold metallo-hydrolase [Oscillospiraceae bacterium]
MTEVHTLASGSSGNALLLSAGSTHILVDAGISCRRMTKSLAALGLCPDDLSAILISHTHSDHIAGLQTLVKHFSAPIYASRQTARGLSLRVAGIDGLLQPFDGACFSVGDCEIVPFQTSHDAAGSTGYRIDTTDGGVGVLTDSGYVTDAARDALDGVALLVLEANHDIETLRSGDYPYYLKQRILGSEGHLSNDDAAAFAVTAAAGGATEIVLAHLSRENNTPVMAFDAVARSLSAAGLSPRLTVAPRDCLSEGYGLERLCRR